MSKTNISLEGLALIDKFVEGLGIREREAATAYIHVSDQPDKGPEIMRLYHLYKGELIGISGKIEELRTQIGCSYDSLQIELQKQLPK